MSSNFWSWKLYKGQLGCTLSFGGDSHMTARDHKWPPIQSTGGYRPLGISWSFRTDLKPPNIIHRSKHFQDTDKVSAALLYP